MNHNAIFLLICGCWQPLELEAGLYTQGDFSTSTSESKYRTILLLLCGCWQPPEVEAGLYTQGDFSTSTSESKYNHLVALRLVSTVLHPWGLLHLRQVKNTIFKQLFRWRTPEVKGTV
jgi:hypothetical protein